MISDLTELFDERSAIREFDGGYSRADAERLAYFELKKLYGRDAIPKEITDRMRRELTKREGNYEM